MLVLLGAHAVDSGDGSSNVCNPGDQACGAIQPVMVQQVVQSFVFVDSDKNPGKRFRRAVMVSSAEDLDKKVAEFCANERIEAGQCTYLTDMLRQKRATTVHTPPTAATLHVIVQYYNDRNPERAQEIDTCLRFNLANPHVLKVHVLLEHGILLPSDIQSHPKLEAVQHGKRLTFKAAFEYASSTLPSNSSAALINGDIYLDHDSPWHTFTGRLEELSAYGRGAYSLALARAEVDSTGKVWKTRSLQRELAYSFAQDAWIFKTPLIPEDVDFAVGNCPGSDNAIAERLYRAGHMPLNLCHIFRIYHLDSARKKQQDPGMIYTNKTDRSHPERRGFRTVPSFGEVRSFGDLVAHKWTLDPIMEYIYMTEYLASSTELGHPS